MANTSEATTETATDTFDKLLNSLEENGYLIEAREWDGGSGPLVYAEVGWGDESFEIRPVQGTGPAV